MVISSVSSSSQCSVLPPPRKEIIILCLCQLVGIPQKTIGWIQQNWREKWRLAQGRVLFRIKGEMQKFYYVMVLLSQHEWAPGQSRECWELQPWDSPTSRCFSSNKLKSEYLSSVYWALHLLLFTFLLNLVYQVYLT